MKKLNVLGIGELLWDIFNDSRKPGGAPANVAFHLNQLGMNGIIASRIGEDSLGEEIQKFLMEMGISVSFLQHDSNHPTGTVTVELDQSGCRLFPRSALELSRSVKMFRGERSRRCLSFCRENV